MFWRDLQRFGDAPALINHDGKVVSYRALVDLADSVAPRPATRKMLVQIAMDNSVASIAACLGALRAGCAVLIVDEPDSDASRRLRQQYAPDAIYDGTSAFTLQPDADRSSEIIHDELAMILSTSGSTGSTKGVRLSFTNLATNAAAIADYLKLSANDRALLTLPLHYCYGLSVLHSHLHVGASVITGLASAADTGFVELLRSTGTTNFACVPFSVALLERIGFRRSDLPALRFITQAGGKLSSELVKAYAEWAAATGKQFFVMYGQTEATARMAYLPPDLTSQYPDCMGVAIPGGLLMLRDELGNAVEQPHTQGEIVYRGPNVMLGYATSRSDLARGREIDELRTGDIGCRNELGLFYVVGRAARFAKIYGKRLNLEDVEQFLRGEGLTAVCVSDDKRLFAFSDEHLTQRNLPRSVAEKFSLSVNDVVFPAPVRIPRLATGKIDYQSLKALASEIPVVVSVAEGPDAQSRLVQLYQRAFPDLQVAPDSTFLSLGGDSLSYVLVSIGIEEILRTTPDGWEKIPLRELADVRSENQETGHRAFSSVETNILLRAVAPIAVVCFHANVPYTAGGAALLMVVSGFNYARFAENDLLAGRVWKPLFNFAINVLIPYWLILISYELLKGNVAFSEIALFNNLVGERTTTPFNTWFIQALLQSILIVSALYTLPPFLAIARRYPFGAAVGMLIAGCTMRLADEHLFHAALDNGGKQLTYTFWLFAAGLAIQRVARFRDKMLLSVAMVMMPVMFFLGISRMTFVAVGGLALIWFPRLPVPTFASRAISIAASASLFVYMMHARARTTSITSDWTFDVIRISTGVALGIITWMIYDKATQLVKRHFQVGKRVRPASPPS